MEAPGALNVTELVGRMSGVPAAVRALVVGMSDEALRWRPEKGAWSVLEVIWHIADEEALDFPVRLRLTIESPEEAWPPIDPTGWAVQRRYNTLALEDGLAFFEQHRAEHIAWLRTLDAEDLESVHEHPRFGPIKAQMLLASWAAHDALHLRQIAKRQYQLVQMRDAPGVDLRYAGEW